MTFVTEACTEILDVLSLIQQKARHCPLGRGDPDQPDYGWAYSLADDPGHPWKVSSVTAHRWIHDGIVMLWWRENHATRMEWVLEAWRIAGPPVQWRFRGFARLIYPRGATRWQAVRWDPVLMVMDVSPLITMIVN
ncbi:hypothetical protein Sulac_1146 [Sulfobacillus acidophilus DSM 10332]|uniref:Uncharacterized protein n=1 Tax=Sulfobacillus acidophilus (strain ATCC 700253 / DSM 10332 / NAL) TaxID=679936 RepID=G8TUJ9_SULAD|nr:hypothetical protein Sulac_1146 [Sulfobacillus acidophilus DSM 10332]